MALLRRERAGSDEGKHDEASTLQVNLYITATRKELYQESSRIITWLHFPWLARIVVLVLIDAPETDLRPVAMTLGQVLQNTKSILVPWPLV